MCHEACTTSWLLLILHVGVGHAVAHTEAELWKTARCDSLLPTSIVLVQLHQLRHQLVVLHQPAPPRCWSARSAASCPLPPLLWLAPQAGPRIVAGGVDITTNQHFFGGPTVLLGSMLHLDA
jgi:hypothetical protein